MGEARKVTVRISDLSFTYAGVDGNPPPGSKPLIQGMSLTLHAGDRCLLVGANGAGKTTLLKIMGGKHIVHPDMVRILERSAFHDTALTASGDLSYLGGEWRRDVAFAGFDVSIQMDVSAEKMIFGVQGVPPERRSKLIKVLDIDLNWRMHKVSDGQRRRVQICMGLLRPFKVLLLDEITVDLDVVTRADLMSFLTSECAEGATIIYATHIFDGLETWPSHIAYVANGKLQFLKSISDIEEMKEMSLMAMSVTCGSSFTQQMRTGYEPMLSVLLFIKKPTLLPIYCICVSYQSMIKMVAASSKIEFRAVENMSERADDMEAQQSFASREAISMPQPHEPTCTASQICQNCA